MLGIGLTEGCALSFTDFLRLDGAASSTASPLRLIAVFPVVGAGLGVDICTQHAIKTPGRAEICGRHTEERKRASRSSSTSLSFFKLRFPSRKEDRLILIHGSWLSYGSPDRCSSPIPILFYVCQLIEVLNLSSKSTYGALGTVVARTLCMREVEGSNPSASSFFLSLFIERKEEFIYRPLHSAAHSAAESDSIPCSIYQC